MTLGGSDLRRHDLVCLQGHVVMGTNAKSPYQQVIEKTKDLAYKSQMLVMAVEKKLRKGGKEVRVSRNVRFCRICMCFDQGVDIPTFGVGFFRLTNSQKVIP